MKSENKQALIRRMIKEGVLTQEEVDQAKEFRIKYIPRKKKRNNTRRR